jgi:CRP-like cAMP-binding protein
VVEGKVQVLKQNSAGQEIIIATLSNGQAVGEMAIIDGLTRSATVKSLTKAKVLILKREDFEKVINEDPHVGIKVLKALARSMSITLRDRSEDLARLMLG